MTKHPVSQLPEQSKALPKLVGKTAARYLKFLFKRATLKGNFQEKLATIDDHAPFIFAMWHGQVLMMPLIKPEQIPVSAMVARHGDAQFIAEALKPFGVNLIRGAGSGHRKKDRGGAYAMRAALKALKAGRSLGMTAEVPPGPSQQSSLGILMIAKLSKRPIIPVAMASTRYKTLNNWSRLSINLPSKNIGIMIGEPIYVPANADENALERYRIKLDEAMEEMSAKAYEHAGANRTKSLPLARQNIPFNWRHKLVSTGLTLAGAVIGLVYRYRESKGKEITDRRGERYGKTNIKRPQGTLLWIHCASVGESQIALQIINYCHKDRPDQMFLLTTGTVTSSKLIADQKNEKIIHQFLPFDSPLYVNRFLDHWKPDLGLLTESEIWPVLIQSSHEKQIPLMIVNGRMSKKSHRKWRKNPKFAAPLFGVFDTIMVQSHEYARRFRDSGGKNILVTGNIKIDAEPLPFSQEAFDALKNECGTRPVFVAASTHTGEDEIILHVHQRLRQTYPNLLTILIPRHPERADAIVHLLNEANISYAQRSKNQEISPQTSLYLADTIGEMGLFYKLGDVVFIGGSLVPHGGQNPIEALRFHKPVISGPHVHNFTQVFDQLIAAGGVDIANNRKELFNKVSAYFEDPALGDKKLTSALEGLEQLSGGLSASYEQIRSFIAKLEVNAHND